MAEKNPGDLEMARDFLRRASAQLDLDPALISELTPHLLGLTKRVAHGVVRPAAPLAAFLVGYAAAQAGSGQAGALSTPDAIAQALVAIAGIDDVVEEADGQA
ncbi:DUF6457 domain-containing protein [Rothia sp. P5766]|uniref:DUF6457 domain-containing protein n=1 Tax=Rothia sp. P5766 TaxID=3402656 RepID=UPI003AE2B471